MVVNQGLPVSLWLFDIFMGKWVRNAKVSDVLMGGMSAGGAEKVVARYEVVDGILYEGVDVMKDKDPP